VAEEASSRPAAVVVPKRSAEEGSGTRRTTVRPTGQLPARLFRRPGGHGQLATAPGPQPARRTAAKAVVAAPQAQKPGVRTVRGHRAVFARQAVHPGRARTAAAAERKPPRLATGHAAGTAEAGRAAGGTVAEHGEGTENRRDGARTPATETGIVSRPGGGRQSVRRPATDSAEDRRGETEDGRAPTTLSTAAAAAAAAATAVRARHPGGDRMSDAVHRPAAQIALSASVAGHRGRALCAAATTVIEVQSSVVRQQRRRLRKRGRRVRRRQPIGRWRRPTDVAPRLVRVLQPIVS